MIPLKDAIEVIRSLTNEKIKKVADYKEYYLFLVDGSSPFYVVRKTDGAVRFISPLEDFASFSEAITKKVLKVFA